MGIATAVFFLTVFLAFGVEVIKKRQPWWQGIIVLVLPPAALYFMVKSKNKNLPIWALGLVLGLGIAAGIEGYLYKDYKETHKYSHLPREVQRMISLNDDIMASTITLYKAMAKLSGLSLVQSRAKDLETTLDQIATLRELIRENTRDISHMLTYIESHDQQFKAKGLDWAFKILAFYKSSYILQQRQSGEQYFTTFENFIQYTHKNYHNIMEVKSPRHQANYEAYYMRYRRSADRYNRTNRELIRFQDRFIEKNPGVKPFLPGSHNLQFKFWDKFSF
jgi:hypothetical protein